MARRPSWRSISGEVLPWDVDELFLEFDPFRGGRTTRVSDIPAALAKLYADGPLSRARVVAIAREWVSAYWPTLRDARTKEPLFGALAQLGAWMREEEAPLYERLERRRDDAATRQVARLFKRVEARRARAVARDPGSVSTPGVARAWARSSALPRPLYHATMHGRAILRDGLRAREATRNATLGGGPEHLVSLTEDREGARRIAAALAAIAEAYVDPTGVCDWFRTHWLPWVRVKAPWERGLASGRSHAGADSARLVKHYFDALGSAATTDPTLFWAAIPWIMGPPGPAELADVGVVVAYANVDQLQGADGSPVRGGLARALGRVRGPRRIGCPSTRGGPRVHGDVESRSAFLVHAALGEDTCNAAEKHEVRVCPSDLTVVAFERAPDWRTLLRPPHPPLGSTNRRKPMPATPSRDVSKTQLERCVLAVYEDFVAKGADAHDRATVSKAYAICTKSLQRGGYLVEGTQVPTLKGHRRAREKVAEPEAQEKRARFQAMLDRVRKGPARSRMPASVSASPRGPSLSKLMAEAGVPVGAPARTKVRGAANVLPLPMGSANRTSDLRIELVPLRDVLDDVFACTTAFGDCKAKRPSAGHCMLSAMIVQDLFGGEIVSGEVQGIPHYWNRVQGVDIDLTGDQFGYQPVRVKRGALYRGGRVFPREQGRALALPWNGEIMGKYQRFAGKVVGRMKLKGQAPWAVALARTQAMTKKLRRAA